MNEEARELIEENVTIEDLIEKDSESLVAKEKTMVQTNATLTNSLVYIAAALFFNEQINMAHFAEHVIYLLVTIAVIYIVKMGVLSVQDRMTKALGEVFVEVVLEILTLNIFFVLCVLVALIRNYFQPTLADLPYVLAVLVIYSVLTKTYFRDTKYQQINECRAATMQSPSTSSPPAARVGSSLGGSLRSRSRTRQCGCCGSSYPS